MKGDTRSLDYRAYGHEVGSLRVKDHPSSLSKDSES